VRRRSSVGRTNPGFMPSGLSTVSLSLSYPKPTKSRRDLILRHASRQTIYPSAFRIAFIIFYASSSSRGIAVAFQNLVNEVVVKMKQVPTSSGLACPLSSSDEGYSKQEGEFAENISASCVSTKAGLQTSRTSSHENGQLAHSF
jgi:hypothetical protein